MPDNKMPQRRFFVGLNAGNKSDKTARMPTAYTIQVSAREKRPQHPKGEGTGEGNREFHRLPSLRRPTRSQNLNQSSLYSIGLPHSIQICFCTLKPNLLLPAASLLYFSHKSSKIRRSGQGKVCRSSTLKYCRDSLLTV